MNKTLIAKKKKCPICKKGYIIKRYYNFIGFVIEENSSCYIYPYCSKECFGKAKQRGLWK